MKRLILGAVALVAFSAAGLAQAQAQDLEITIGTEGAFPPWNGTNPNGELFGAEIDLIAALCAEMNATCETVTNDFDSMIPALQAGRFDAIMAAMSITDERRQSISFSNGYFGDPARIAVLDGSPLVGIETVEKLNLDNLDGASQASLDALKAATVGMTIGAQGSTTHSNFIEQILGGDVTLKTYGTQDDLNLDLQAGRIDAAVAENSVWSDLIDSDPSSGIALIGPTLDGGPFGEGIGVGLRQADTDLLAAFNAALAVLKANGTLSRISIEWFGVDASL